MQQEKLQAYSFITAISLHVIAAIIFVIYLNNQPEIIAKPEILKIRLGSAGISLGTEEEEKEDELLNIQKAEENNPEKIANEPEIAQPTPQPEKKKTTLDNLKVGAKQTTPTKFTSTKKSGSIYGNSLAQDAKAAATYIDLLQLTVQETSRIPKQAREQNLAGNAILRLSFNRRGYVMKYSLIQKTGYNILDRAAIEVARKLTHSPFPPVPQDFDAGAQVLTYDFPISFDPTKYHKTNY
ncbi:MAG: hypothetical protein COV36_08150 [Alphaproteobacteria bacterium CG11_big_fil_rev_8_21_14_0_20_44_7]|nr:MAG: hypothetical protein COV36_08150 [Alphaproteobacteria bacterium CG11_big_fil_rev_8_21_14_0_20_44_7]